MDADIYKGFKKMRKKLGKKVLVRMLEAAGLVTVGNEESYGRFPTIQDVINALNGQTVAIKVGIKKGTDGHADKNSVTDYYSPNPDSGYADKFKQVMAGSSAQTPSIGGKPGFLTSPKNGNPF